MKRIVTKLVGIVLLSLMTTSVFAQGGYQVKGVVTDAMGPVIGATVIEVGTSNGTTTGLDGDYTLRVASADATVEISCIGYTTVSYKASEVPATVTLEEDSEFLDEVVVIGYGTVKKSDLTGSVSTVKADEINKGVITSPPASSSLQVPVCRAPALPSVSVAALPLTLPMTLSSSSTACPSPMTASAVCRTLCPPSIPRISRASPS